MIFEKSGEVWCLIFLQDRQGLILESHFLSTQKRLHPDSHWPFCLSHRYQLLNSLTDQTNDNSLHPTQKKSFKISVCFCVHVSMYVRLLQQTFYCAINLEGSFSFQQFPMKQKYWTIYSSILFHIRNCPTLLQNDNLICVTGKDAPMFVDKSELALCLE